MDAKLQELIKNQKEPRKFRPAWIVIVVAITIVIAAIVWLPAEIVPRLELKPVRSPSLSPTSPKVIMVDNVNLLVASA